MAESSCASCRQEVESSGGEVFVTMHCFERPPGVPTRDRTRLPRRHGHGSRHHHPGRTAGEPETGVMLWARPKSPCISCCVDRRAGHVPGKGE
jgi:hypothetical protein